MIVEGWDGFIRYSSSDPFRHDIKSKCLKKASIEGDILLSVFIPTYKRKDFLREAIDSAINQQDPGINYEIVVVSNDPETDLSDIINDYSNINNISFYANEENIQWVGNWNRGLLLSKGKYMTLLHDDDLLKPNYVHEMGKILQDPKYSDAGAFSMKSDFLFQNADNDKPVPNKNFGKFLHDFARILLCITLRILTLFRYFYRRNVIELKPEISLSIMTCIYSACGPCFNREMLLNDGGWNEEGNPAADWYTWIRFNQNHKIFKVRGKTLVTYRWAVNGSFSITKTTWACTDIGLLCKKWQSEKLNKIIAKNKDYLASMAIQKYIGEVDIEEISRYFGIKINIPTKLQCFLWEWRNYIIYVVYNLDR